MALRCTVTRETHFLHAAAVRDEFAQLPAEVQEVTTKLEDLVEYRFRKLSQLRDWLDSGKSIDLIDVREPAEWEIVRIPGAHLVPKGEFLNGTALADLPQDKQIVLYCKSGVRSAEALAAVKAAGFRDAVHVQGGVVSWIKTVDPSLPIY